METEYRIESDRTVAEPEESGDLTDSQLIAVLRQALQHAPADNRPAGFMRTEEIAETLGIGLNRCRRELRKQIRDGRVESRKIVWVGISGDICRVPAYRLKNGDF